MEWYLRTKNQSYRWKVEELFFFQFYIVCRGNDKGWLVHDQKPFHSHLPHIEWYSSKAAWHSLRLGRVKVAMKSNCSKTAALGVGLLLEELELRLVFFAFEEYTECKIVFLVNLCEYTVKHQSWHIRCKPGIGVNHWEMADWCHSSWWPDRFWILCRNGCYYSHPCRSEWHHSITW